MFEALSLWVEASRSLRIEDGERLRALPRVEAIVIVGATCAGKSTLVEAIRGSAQGEGTIDIPLRYLTRPRRGNESPGENVHLSAAQFEERARAGDIGLHWARQMEGGREERYGFRPAAPGRLPVYPGNNALYSNEASVRPKGTLRHALFVGIHAPDEVREARLRKRSPDLCSERPDEVAYRLADSSTKMLGHVHLVVANHGPLEAVAPGEAVELVRLVERLRAAAVPR
ncbi:MAG: hypothetical protein ACYC8T_20115 [Myxococcaceae bacterium]